MSSAKSESAQLFDALLHGDATSGEYVAALRHEASERVRDLRGADRVTDAAKTTGQGVDGGTVAPEPVHPCDRPRKSMGEKWNEWRARG